jgi:hypothetical protein
VSVGVLLPYVKNRVDVFASPSAGNVGLNPALTFTGARSQNGQVVSQLQAAGTMLQAELTRCLNSTDASCNAINANRQAAQELVANAGAAANAVGAVYGTTTTPGSPFAPVAATPLQAAVEARLAALSTSFDGFLGMAPGGDWITARPVPAAPLGYNDLQALLTDAAFGIEGRPLRDVEHSHIGDVEVGAKVRLIDTFGLPVGAVIPGDARGLRVSVAGILRLPTAQRPAAADFVGLGTGDRQTDIEVRGFADLLLNRRFWTSAVVRYALQQGDRLTMRITDRPGDPFPARFREQEVQRDLGDVMEIELAPHFAPTDALSFSADYRFRQKGADSYAGTFTVPGPGATPLVLDASTLGLDSGRREHRFGVALTYSTLRGYAERRARWPLEVSLIHTRVVGGVGVMRDVATGVGLRIYRRVRGPNPLRPPR